MPNANAFTLDEINQILDQLNANPGARLQYIGSRYVPIFGRKGEDSIEWDNTGTYEPLTVVLYQGSSYTSRQFVPAGIEITNQEYWANTGNYNAQVEQYRQEVLNYAATVEAYDGRITANADAIATETQNRENADTQINTAIEGINNSITAINSEINVIRKYDVTNYGADKTGAADSTDAIRQAITDAEAGSIIEFPTGTYRAGYVSVEKPLVIDFKGSNIICTSTVLMQFSAEELSGVSINGIDTNENAITGSGLQDGMLLKIEANDVYTTRNRAAYRYGFTCRVNATPGGFNIQPANPIAFGMTNTDITAYQETQCGIKNLAGFTFETDNTQNTAFIFVGICNGFAENITIKGKMRMGVQVSNCYGFKFEKCDFDLNSDAANTVVYPISVTDSSDTTITGCNITSTWHAITTGGNYCCINTKIIGCNLASYNTEAFLDHNAIFSAVYDSSLVGGALFTLGGRIANCEIFGNQNPDNSEPHVYFTPAQQSGFSYTCANCNFNQKGEEKTSNPAFKLYYGNDGTGSTEDSRVNGINISNCTGNLDMLVFYSDDNTGGTFNVNSLNVTNTPLSIYADPDCTVNIRQGSFANCRFNDTTPVVYMPSTLNSLISFLSFVNCYWTLTEDAPVECPNSYLYMANCMMDVRNATGNVTIPNTYIGFLVNCYRRGSISVATASDTLRIANSELSAS